MTIYFSMKNKLLMSIISLIMLAIFINIINVDYFNKLLAIIWSVTSIILIYTAIKYTIKYKFIQLNIKKIIKGIKSKSNNSISPLSSLSLSLAAKIGVGSLSGVALAIYFGGLGTIFWIWIISILVAINTYLECILGVKCKGGPSTYIKKVLKDKKLSTLYSILIIISYSFLFLSIQSNTIIKTLEVFNLNTHICIILLTLIVYIIISKGVSRISFVNSILVPFMLIVYLLLGIYVLIKNSNNIPLMFNNIIKSAFNIKSIISVFLIGMQRAIFITESGIGTSAISSSVVENNEENQAMLEVMGIHITTFLVCNVTFIIIAMSNYTEINFNNINGIELVLHAFNYHFGSLGTTILSLITIMFAFSTITSGYFFGENNLMNLTPSTIIKNIFKILSLLVLILSAYISPKILWNYTDLFVALLAIINITSILRILNKK
mgnify:FL=1